MKQALQTRESWYGQQCRTYRCSLGTLKFKLNTHPHTHVYLHTPLPTDNVLLIMGDITVDLWNTLIVNNYSSSCFVTSANLSAKLADPRHESTSPEERTQWPLPLAAVLLTPVRCEEKAALLLCKPQREGLNFQQRHKLIHTNTQWGDLWRISRVLQ